MSTFAPKYKIQTGLHLGCVTHPLCSLTRGPMNPTVAATYLTDLKQNSVLSPDQFKSHLHLYIARNKNWLSNQVEISSIKLIICGIHFKEYKKKNISRDQSCGLNPVWTDNEVRAASYLFGQTDEVTHSSVSEMIIIFSLHIEMPI